MEKTSGEGVRSCGGILWAAVERGCPRKQLWGSRLPGCTRVREGRPGQERSSPQGSGVLHAMSPRAAAGLPWPLICWWPCPERWTQGHTPCHPRAESAACDPGHCPGAGAPGEGRTGQRDSRACRKSITEECPRARSARDRSWPRRTGRPRAPCPSPNPARHPQDHQRHLSHPQMCVLPGFGGSSS